MIGAATAVLDKAATADPPLVLDYLVLVDPATFAPVTSGGEAVLAVVDRVGATHLIDNVHLQLGKEH